MKRNFLRLICTTLLGTLVSTQAYCQAPAKNSPQNQPAGQQKTTNADITTIRSESEAFVAAFNKGDAKAIAAMWTADGEYIDDTGRRFNGRAEIEKCYADLFAANPNAKIKINIDSLRLLSSDSAIEDGRVFGESLGSAGFTKYTVTHVKVNGKWLMGSVRDTWIETSVATASSADLEWLVGTWVAEEYGVKTESICRWVADGRFLERAHTTTQVDGTKSSGVQLIGWNPQLGSVQSWAFSPDGGHAVGTWNSQAGGWMAELQGFTGDGLTSTSINHLRRLDDNTYAWQSIARTIGSETLPDTLEVVWKRQPAKQPSK